MEKLLFREKFKKLDFLPTWEMVPYQITIGYPVSLHTSNQT